MNPYLITGPALVSFSGGRSSAYMLKHILDANASALPDDVVVAFMNTGKERPETLEFVAECGERWGVRIRWLEYTTDGFAEINFATAARGGEPFELLIRTRQFLPNPVIRFCTQELKVRVAKKLMLSLGYKHWDMVLGLRADEPQRLAKMRAANDAAKERWEQTAPMATAGVTKSDVSAWWDQQPFHLRLPVLGGITPAGNCDLCFLKGASTLLELMKEHPEWADWWVTMERLALASAPSCATFRIDRPAYAKMQQFAKNQTRMFEAGDPGIECFCGD